MLLIISLPISSLETLYAICLKTIFRCDFDRKISPVLLKYRKMSFIGEIETVCEYHFFLCIFFKKETAVKLPYQTRLLL